MSAHSDEDVRERFRKFTRIISTYRLNSEYDFWIHLNPKVFARKAQSSRQNGEDLENVISEFRGERQRICLELGTRSSAKRATRSVSTGKAQLDAMAESASEVFVVCSSSLSFDSTSSLVSDQMR
jgi:hypothetical protein